MHRVNISVPLQLWRQFRSVCALRGISASAQIVQLVQQFLEKEGQS